MKTAWKALIAGACGITAIAAVVYTGYVTSYLDDEVQTTFFLKRYPTFQMEFYDLFANEGDDVPIENLPAPDRQEFADYCKYRFGITDQNLHSLEASKAKIPKYLRCAINGARLRAARHLRLAKAETSSGSPPKPGISAGQSIDWQQKARQTAGFCILIDGSAENQALLPTTE